MSPTVLGWIALAFGIGGLVGWLAGRRGRHEAELRLAATEASLRSAAQVDAEREQTLDLALERLRSGFDAVAGQALRGNSELFLQLARQTLARQQDHALRNLTDREKAVEGMLAPVREALKQTQEQILRIEKERAESFGALRASLESVALGQASLQRETRNLVTALRRPEVRGQWGELTLRRLAELAGMVERCDFVEQVHTPGEDGSLRPDMIVNMPDGRRIVVDVKTPLDAYLTAAEASSDDERATALKRHAGAVQERVRQLAQKAYWAQFEHSPDFVVLFIPGDQFLSAAVAEAPTLLEDAIRQHVIIATPTSFVALLKAVAYGWRQNALAENALRIQELGEETYRRLATFVAHLARVGRSLGQSVEAYNAAVGSLERQVLPGARKFTDLGLRPAKEMDTLAPVEKLAREPVNVASDSFDPTAPEADGERSASDGQITSPAPAGEVARSAGEGQITSPAPAGEVARSAGEGQITSPAPAGEVARSAGEGRS
jgi:DNA recombination protein RmuC